MYVFTSFNHKCYEYSRLYVNVTDKKIYITCTIFESMICVKTFYEDAYSKYCSPENTIVYFTSNSNKWSFPSFRRPRSFNNINLTYEMNSVLDDIDNFMNNENYYQNRAIPYRRGYLLWGGSGTGKSTIIEMTAKKCGFDVHILSLNGSNMDDSSLLNLFNGLPAYSIVVIEEIDKQLELLKKNPNSLVSIGGLKTAIDGCQRMPHSCLLFMTCNDRSFASDDDDPLIRPGRIDLVQEFNTKLII